MNSLILSFFALSLAFSFSSRHNQSLRQEQSVQRSATSRSLPEAAAQSTQQLSTQLSHLKKSKRHHKNLNLLANPE